MAITPTNTSGNVFLAKIQSKLKNFTSVMAAAVAKRLNELLKQRLQASGLKNRTGALRRSVQVKYQINSNGVAEFTVGTMIYGVFNSFGVGPRTRHGKVYKVPDWIKDDLKTPPSGGDRFSYNPSHRKFGIPARKWLPDDDALQLIISDFITEYEASLP